MRGACSDRHILPAHRVGLRKILVLAILSLALLPLWQAQAQPSLSTGIDLSTYVRVGRYSLPEPTRTTLNLPP
jgi:hypothetical protein